MVPRAGYLLCLTMAFWPLPASAQPLFRCERNWTVTVDDQLYGLRQELKIPGDIRFTQVWIGHYTFTMNCRAMEVIALPLLPAADLIPRCCCQVDWRSFRRLP